MQSGEDLLARDDDTRLAEAFGVDSITFVLWTVRGGAEDVAGFEELEEFAQKYGSR